MVEPKENSMRGINSYGRELSEEEIDANVHRNFVGGLWEEVGKLQFDFLKAQGLQPSHKFLDVGCGCLRGGLHYIRYLEEGHYYGLDINLSLLQAGVREIKAAGLDKKRPNLLVDDLFKLEKFGESFDFMVSISLFTHLPMNIIIRCLSEVRKSLKPDGTYLATFFEAPESAYLETLHHDIGGVNSSYDADPFHYSPEEMSWMASASGLEFELIGDWNHPRNQKMASFSIKQ